MRSRLGYYVGRWMRRSANTSARWHHVESKIATAYITRCGKRMERRLPSTGDEVEFHSEVPAAEICRYCRREDIEETNL